MAKSNTLASASLDELEAELNRRRKKLPRLQKKREKLEAELASVNEQIALLESIPGETAKSAKSGKKAKKTRKKSTKRRTRRKRAKNAVPLADVLAEALKGKDAVGISEAMELAEKSGYKSKSSQFRNIVNQTLSKDDRFKKVGRGKYALK
jgi:septal ring factor EnvC (AmiA/AmiB activator)